MPLLITFKYQTEKYEKDYRMAPHYSKRASLDHYIYIKSIKKYVTLSLFYIHFNDLFSKVTSYNCSTKQYECNIEHNKTECIILYDKLQSIKDHVKKYFYSFDCMVCGYMSSPR